VAEAEKIATLVKARGLDVYVDEICASACTLVFVAGKNRLLSPGGSLGFHGSYFPGMSKQELASANDDLASQYRSAGVDALFIRRALSVPPDEMWFPTANELQMARVVTVLGGGTASAATTNAVAVPLTPAVAPPKDTKSLTLGEVERELRSASGLMDAIHLVEPETARAIYSFVQAHYGEFGANTDVAAQVKAMMSEVVARHYQEADDDVLVAIATLTADQSAALLAEDPALCHVYLVGGAGSGEAYTRIPENLRSLETELSERVLRTATPRPTLAPGRLEAIYQDVANSAFGASSDRQLQLLAGDVKAVTPADFGQYCMAVVLYYRAIASLAPAAAADAMRGILSSTN